MNDATVTVILHGARWPDHDGLEACVQALETVAPGRVIRARERADQAVGAATLINRTAADCAGGVLLVAEPCVVWQPEQLAAVASAARQGLVLTGCAPDFPALHDAQNGPPRKCRLWGITTGLFRNLGGLDDRLWSVGELADLQARTTLLTGGPVTHLESLGRWIGPEPYPLRGDVARLLAVRNPLITSFKTCPTALLGPRLARLTASALVTAWRAAAIDDTAFRIGGTWGGTASPPRSRHDDRGTTIWPQDEPGTLVPLLALDAFLWDVPTLLAERRRLDPDGRQAEAPTSSATCRSEVPGDVMQAIRHVVESGTPPASHPEPTEAPARPAIDVGARRETTDAATARPEPLPTLSVIVVNWNGRDHLRACFDSLRRSDYPAGCLELILVDNGSTDGSRELMEKEFPEVRLVGLESNRGFTGGNNAGVAAARHEVLVFLNNDMRVEPTTLSNLVTALDDQHPCVAARVLSWDGRRIDFVGGTLNFEARGFQDHYGKRVRPELVAGSRTFFPNGGAFAVRRTAYASCGGFDDRFFAYYDDVDLGWRLRMAGHEIRVADEAVVYHRHGATSRRYPKGQKRFLMERNALWTVMKNYEAPTLARALGPILLLATRRIVQQTIVRRGTPFARALAPFSPSCRRGRTRARRRLGWNAPDVYEPEPPDAQATDGTCAAVIRRLPVESLAAVGSALAATPDVAVTRREVQARRVVPDAQLLPHFGRALERDSNLRSYTDAQDALVEALNLRRLFEGRTRVLIITHEPLRPNMSGPGVRALEMGRGLSRSVSVTVATPYPPEINDDRCTLAPYTYRDASTLRTLAEQCDLIVARGFTLSQFPFLTGLDVPIVLDLYCPFTLEHLEMTSPEAKKAPERMDAVSAEAADILAIQNNQLHHGDFFICATERQRDFWLGTLHTAGRINPLNYGQDPSLRSLIDVVPFGLPDAPPATDGPRALKGVHPGIRTTDHVLLWGGSVLDWQDPQIIIRAVAQLARERDDVKLFFMGIRHPNPQVVPMRAVAESLALARDLGVLDRHVFFNDWVPYADRVTYLLDADLGVSTHRDHLETRFSFRTRMLDYIWAGLPILCTTGDHFAAIVEAHGVGLTVSPGDDAALVDAIRRLLEDDALRHRCRQNLHQLAGTLGWSQVVEPLRRFCEAPRFAPDRAPVMAELRRRLERGFRVSKWLKRTALDLGLSEGRVERLKELGIVQAGVSARNRLARRRARTAVDRMTRTTRP